MSAILDHILVPALIAGALVYLLGRRFLSRKGCHCASACCNLATRKPEAPFPKKKQADV